MALESDSRPGTSPGLAAAIREEIFQGTFEPGSALREMSLAERYHLSRRTVREALLMLAAEGLVVHRHNQGASVRVFNGDDVSDLYLNRRILELEGARRSSSAPVVLLEEVRSAMQRYEEVSALGLMSVELARADAEFHRTIIALVQSPRLNQYFDSIAQQFIRVITLVQTQDLYAQRPVESVISEHRAISDAITHRDVWEAQRLIIEHTSVHEKNLLESSLLGTSR